MNTKYIRKGHVIETIHLDGKNTIERFMTNDRPSINKAKKQSHALQLANGGLGLGSVMRG